jgi:hypothetical protein
MLDKLRERLFGRTEEKDYNYLTNTLYVNSGGEYYVWFEGESSGKRPVSEGSLMHKFRKDCLEEDAFRVSEKWKDELEEYDEDRSPIVPGEAADKWIEKTQERIKAKKQSESG